MDDAARVVRTLNMLDIQREMARVKFSILPRTCRRKSRQRYCQSHVFAQKIFFGRPATLRWDFPRVWVRQNPCSNLFRVSSICIWRSLKVHLPFERLPEREMARSPSSDQKVINFWRLGNQSEYMRRRHGPVRNVQLS